MSVDSRSAKAFSTEHAILWLKGQAKHYDEQMHFLEADAYRSIIATIEALARSEKSNVEAQPGNKVVAAPSDADFLAPSGGSLPNTSGPAAASAPFEEGLRIIEAAARRLDAEHVRGDKHREEYRAMADAAMSGRDPVKALADKLNERSTNNQSALDVLRELVRLKDIKDQLDDNDAGVRPMRADVWAAMTGDYQENKPKAWQAARDVLGRKGPQ